MTSRILKTESAAEVLEAFDRLYQEGDLEGALALSSGACERYPEDAALLHAHGLALWACR